MKKTSIQTVAGVDYQILDEPTDLNEKSLRSLMLEYDSIPLNDWEFRCYYHLGNKYQNNEWCCVRVNVTAGAKYYVMGCRSFIFAAYNSSDQHVGSGSTSEQDMPVGESKEVTMPAGASYCYFDFKIQEVKDGYITIRTTKYTDGKLFKIHPNFSLCRSESETKAAGIVDLDKANGNTIYRIQPQSRSHIANLPADFPMDGAAQWYLLTIQTHWTDVNPISYPNSYNQRIQYLMKDDLLTWYKRIALVQTGEYGNWVKTQNGNTVGGIVECGPGKTYTTIRSAVSVACSVPGSTIIVYPGTYDLTQEFATEIASGILSAYGNYLYNDVTIKFLPGSYVKALVTTPSESAASYFNPFYGHDFTLDGLNIEASNCRYCVHDEQAGADMQYHNVIRNCIMKNTSSSDNTFPHYHQCIGGGLGQNGYIEIIGGKYTSIDENNPDYVDAISYHNGYNVNADSRIFIRDLYLGDGNCIRFGSYGPSTIKSPVFVSGCSMGDEIIVAPETAGSGADNFVLTEWGNTVRT